MSFRDRVSERSSLLARFRESGRLGPGQARQAMDAETVATGLDALGAEEAAAARALAERVQATMPSISALSDLSAPVALGYLERVQRPIKALTLDAGVLLTTRGYVAQLVVERDPTAFGADDVPVVGTLPPLDHGHVPGDLLKRLILISRRQFDAVRAVSAGVWDGFVLLTLWHVHETTDALVDQAVVDELLRIGWLLRQADLHYGLNPERAAGAGSDDGE